MKSIAADIRAMGSAGWMVYETDRALGLLSRGRAGLHVLRFYAQPVPEKELVPRRANDSFLIHAVSRDTVPESAFQRPSGAIAQRFDDGSTCIAALKGDELAGFMWLQPGILRERIVRCRFHALPSTRVEWDYDFYIHPRHRLGRLFARLWDTAFLHLRERGIVATVSWVHLHNRPSSNAHARLGATPIGWAMFVVMFGHQVMITSMRPKFAYSRPGRTLDLFVHAGAPADDLR
ncbi:MAG: GNAT family N-acetyltransferase [Burkholderiaceae bacterium]|jgi:GNAT superfamily N-acetyltransferase|nr:GNAT family N-acetyltransferase [Burkholderiaceae bacterium]